MSVLNDRQRQFAELVVSGMAAGRAYEKAGYAARGDSADQAASRLLGNVKVSQYVEELRAIAREAAKMSLEELQQFLADAIRTPIAQIDPNHPLCQEYVIVQERGGPRGKLKRGDASSGNETETPEEEVIKIKTVDKLRAAGLLIGTNGWNKPQVLQHGLTEETADILKRIRSRRETP